MMKNTMLSGIAAIRGESVIYIDIEGERVATVVGLTWARIVE